MSRPIDATFELTDIKHIEVLRGFQATLYGLVFTQSPTDVLASQTGLLSSDLQQTRIVAFAGGPLVKDWLQERLSVSCNAIGDWVDNHGPSGRDVGGASLSHIRAAFELTAGDTAILTLRAYQADIETLFYSRNLAAINLAFKYAGAIAAQGCTDADR